VHEADSFEAERARAAAGDAEGQTALAKLLLEAGGAGARAEAEQWLRRAAERGFARAKHLLGGLCLQDDKRGAEAVEWFRQAAHDGWPESIYMFAAMSERRGDIETARRLYVDAALKGYALAQDAVSGIHFERDTEEDHAPALHWAKAAARQGVPQAFTRLGTIYHEGRGTAQDPERAIACFLEGARRGHAGGQVMIGVAFHIGNCVATDLVESAHWLMRSVAQDHELGRIYLPDVLTELRPHQIKEAEWRANAPLPPVEIPAWAWLQDDEAD